MRNNYLKFVMIGILIVIAGVNRTVGEEPESKIPISNEICLTCHDSILSEEPKNKDILPLHRRHIESKRTEYSGKQSQCVTCHSAWVPETPGWLDSGVHHPDVVMEPGGFWKKNIQKKNKNGKPAYLSAINPDKPYTFKPLLERLVCIDCHGTNSKIKILYGKNK